MERSAKPCRVFPNFSLCSIVTCLLLTSTFDASAQQSDRPDSLGNRVDFLQHVAGEVEAAAIRNMKAEQEAAKAAAKNSDPAISQAISEEALKLAPEEFRILWAEVASKEYARRREAEVKTELLLTLAAQAKRDFEQAKSAPNPAHAEFMRREAESKAELAERVMSQFGRLVPSPQTPPHNPTPARPASPGDAGNQATTEPPLSKPARVKPKLQPISIQWEKVESRLQEAAVEADPQLIHDRAARDFGEGRAGAGGVALYRPAELIDGPGEKLDPRTITGVDFSGDRPALLLKDRRILFPAIEPEYLALSVRNVYGREGIVKGILTAEEANAVIVQTGRQQFGEVVWKKEFLPEAWKPVPAGNTVELELGPGLGLLNSTEPSVSRVTYYGPIKDTKMGRVLLDADQVMTTLMQGIDPHTGRATDLPKIGGFMTVLERQVRALLAPKSDATAQASSTNDSDAKPPDGTAQKKSWWTDIGWLVWVPDRFTFRVTSDGTALEFVETRLRLDVWSVNPPSLAPEYQQTAEHFSAHYTEYLAAFPSLRELQEVTKAVSLVRWLKAQNVPVDPEWAKKFAVAKVATPATVRRYECRIVWEQGKPRVQKGGTP